MSYVIIGLIIVACIIHSVLKKSKETADQAVNDAIVPGVMNTLFDDVQMIRKGIYWMLRDRIFRCKHIAILTAAAIFVFVIRDIRQSCAVLL